METKAEKTEAIAFIGKYVIPAASKRTFLERQQIARAYIHTLAGFLRDHAYERTMENGDTEYITIALWADADALNNARESVNAENLRTGFNRAEMLEKLRIRMEPGVFREDHGPF